MKRQLIRAACLSAACLGAACSPSPGERAEPEAGICWRVRANPGQAPVREALDRDIANLQTCAARLEAVRMMDGGAVEGAFEGRSIFVSEAEITQAPSRSGTRYPVFEPEQRRAVQDAIQRLLERSPDRKELRP